MKESFDEYKKTIERNVIKFTYLYDGDAKSSIDKTFSEYLPQSSTSVNVILKCIHKIYNDSISDMMGRSIEKVLPMTTDPNTSFSTTADNIFHYIDNLKSEVGISPMYIFCSENGRKLFGINHDPTGAPFPKFFYELERYHSKNYDLYLSPLLIDDTPEQVEIYVVDKSIQSLVYSIQNMEYEIKSSPYNYKHTISYKFYDCDYTCYKLVVKDVSVLREEKINSLLDV